MATATFARIRDDINLRANSLEQLATTVAGEATALRHEAAALRSLAADVQVTIDRLRDTWG
ncbi:MAG: hypothetical protein GC191_17070 [Azospirillum sp.]|nr:hypothetical protein [Azospirillum sp.]